MPSIMLSDPTKAIDSMQPLPRFFEDASMPKSRASHPKSSDTGLDVLDIRNNKAFAARKPHFHDAIQQMEAMQRIAHAFAEGPDAVLQELVDAAVKLCGADSAGISIEREHGTDDAFYQWVATAGQYSPFLNATLPRYPSACTTALDRGAPQVFRVRQPFFDLLGIQAPAVTDGLLLPWQIANVRGTIFIMAHGRTEAFDQTDCRTMQTLADFASIGVQLLCKQALLLEQARSTGAAQMANHLAHEINNPLQSLTNILYLATEGSNGSEAKSVVQQAVAEVATLSSLVNDLLTLSHRRSRRPMKVALHKAKPLPLHLKSVPHISRS